MHGGNAVLHSNQTDIQTQIRAASERAENEGP